MVPEDHRIYATTALAAMNIEREKHVTTILKVSPIGARTQEEAMISLLFTGGDWIPSSLAMQLCAIVEAGGMTALPGAVVLASMSGDPSARVRAMRSAEVKFNSMNGQTRLPGVMLRLAIAKAESKDTSWLRPDLVRLLGIKDEFWIIPYGWLRTYRGLFC